MKSPIVNLTCTYRHHDQHRHRHHQQQSTPTARTSWRSFTSTLTSTNTTANATDVSCRSVISNRIGGNILFLFTWRYLLPSAASLIWLLLMLLVSHVQTSVGINPTIAFHQENELADGRVHYAGRFIGEEAQLPCVVNFDECGQIYFLTWSKNVSNEWQRVYLYSESYQTALGDLAVGDGSRVTLDASNMSSLGLAFLKIRSVSIEDEATYKCDVTYVHGTCPSLTYTRLFALVTPGEPFLRVNGRRIEEPRVPLTEKANRSSASPAPASPSTNQVIRVGPFEEGSTVAIECSTSGGRPLPEVKWYNGSNLLRSKISVTANPDLGSVVTATTRFIVTRFELNSVFTCEVMNNATSHPLSKTVLFDVHVKPLSLRIRGPESAVVSGEMVSMTCSVEGARPAATIDWFNRSELVDPQPVTTEELMPDSTYRTSSTLVFVASRFDQERDFSCVGTNAVLKEKNEVPLLDVTTLKVLYPPECKVRLLPKEKNGHTKIECSAIASPPVSSYTWTKENVTVSTHGDLDDGGKSGGSGSTLIIYDGSIESYTCVTSNMMGVATCKLEAHQIQVSSVTGSNVALPCEVDILKCGKISQILWSKNFSTVWKPILSQTYHHQSEQQFSQMTSRKSTPFNGAMDGVLSMSSMNGKNNKIDQRFTLDTKSNTSHALLRVTSVTIQDEGLYKCDITYVQPTCPSITYVKLHTMVVPSKPVIFVNGNELDSMRVTGLPLNSLVRRKEIPNPSSSTSSTSQLQLQEQEQQQQQQQQQEQVMTSIADEIDEIVTVGPFDEGSVVVLECNSLHGRPTPQVAWFNGSKLMSSKTVITPDSEEGRVTSAVSFVLTRSDLTSQFSCRVWNNATVRPIIRWITFDVHVKPMSLHVRGPISAVAEGELVSLSCIVEDARPPANILWFNRSTPLDPQPLSSSDLLANGAFRTSSTFTFPASRYDHNKDFSCIGTNQMLKKAGEAALVQATTLKVLFAPDCTIRYLASVGSNGSPTLECVANASPGVVNFTWTKSNRSLELQGDLFNSSLLPVTDGELDAFACVASNIQGSSKPCWLEAHHLNDPSGWVQLLLGDENLIIVAVATGVIVFIVVVSTVVTFVFRRKLKGLQLTQQSRQRQLEQRISHHYSRDVVNQTLKSVSGKENKIAILDEQGSKRNSQYLTILQSTGHSASGITCSPLKSPIIRNTYQTISLRPDGSPLLSDYITDGSESPTSAASSIQQHFYERPSNSATTATAASISSAASSTAVVDSFSSVGQPLHNMNIPLGYGPSNLPLNTPPPPPPPMLPERGYLRLPQTLHHSIRPHPSSTRTLLPHHQLLTHAMMNQHSYRSLSRQRTRSGLEYSDFRA